MPSTVQSPVASPAQNLGTDRRWNTLPLESEDLAVLAELQTLVDAPSLPPKTPQPKLAALALAHDTLLPRRFDELLQRKSDIEARLLQVDAMLATLKGAALSLLEGYHQALSSISAHLSFAPSIVDTANPLISWAELYLQTFLESSDLSRAVVNGDVRSVQFLASLARCIEHVSCLRSKGASWKESEETTRLYCNAINVGRDKIISFVQKQISLSMEIESAVIGKVGL